jgi:methylmalonyl-CoA carboxyltransferase small subunit
MKGSGNLKLQITIDGKAYEVDVEVLEEDESEHQPSYPSYQPAPMTLHSTSFPGSYTPASAAGGDGSEEKVCRSPVTGLVMKVNVMPGQAIETNDLIMVLEAMKMETNVTAPRAGKVKSVSVAPGDSVKVNQVVVEFE